MWTATEGVAEGPWLSPVMAVKETFDDNVFLTPSNKSSDRVTILTPGLIFKPELSTHEFEVGYLALLEFFAKNSGQNTKNHSVAARGKLNFNQWHVDFNNTFAMFENRAGTEDTARIPRLNNAASVSLVNEFNKMDVALNYTYRHEDYRSNGRIGDFLGRALTYQDLDSDENSGEIELGFKFWPKTSLLFSGRYGVLKYATGRKSDSDYFDILTGLRGEFMTKGVIEGKIGYRSQNYENQTGDFDSIIFALSLTENFTPRDVLTLTAERTTNSTIQQDNAYFESTTVALKYAHDFTQRFQAVLNGSFGLNDYPTSSTVGGQSAKRDDKILETGLGLNYTMSDWAVLTLAYAYKRRDSNLDANDYKNNLWTLGLSIKF